MKHFYLISNRYKDEGFRLRDTVRDYLNARGAVCEIHEEGGAPSAKTECIISLGGDGTLLRIIRRYADLPLAFIGINTGTVGYLTEGDKNAIPAILNALLSDDYITEKRMMIYGKVFRGKKYLGRHRALNDIVVGRSNSMKIAKLRLSVNGQFLKDYRCDSLIASTPTGSTAYNFSAGGPIVEPTARLFVLTPLAAHSLNGRSLVLPAGDKVQIEILAASPGNESREQYQVYFDGDKPIDLIPGDIVEITRATTTVTIIKLSKRSFVETLRTKLSD